MSVKKGWPPPSPGAWLSALWGLAEDTMLRNPNPPCTRGWAHGLGALWPTPRLLTLQHNPGHLVRGPPPTPDPPQGKEGCGAGLGEGVKGGLKE